jgi:Domain of unknown function (DUF929)
MSKQPTRRAAQKRRPQQRKGRTAIAAKGGRANNRTTWIMVGIVVVIGGALLIAMASSNKKNPGTGDFVKGDQPAPASLVSKVTGVSDSVITAVGAGSVSNPPIKLPGPTLKTADGKPRIVYIGAEYCPFCAAERWGMLNALSRFGTFDNVKITSSAKTTPNGSPETDPGTGTFSFHGSTYKSDYIQFEPVEQHDNSYQPLDTPTAEQDALNKKYDAPPYVSQTDAGAIPFIDFANQYMISGASYEASVLQGRTRDENAAELSNASSAVTQGVVGTANVITATICKVTGDKPADVCNNSAVQALEQQLPTKVPTK